MKRPDSKHSAVCAALVLLAAGVAPAATNLITNPGFESGVAIPTGSFVRLLNGNSTSITGWTVAPDAVDYSGTIWQTPDGTRTVDLDGNIGDAGGVFQAITTVPGKAYKGTFVLAGNLYSGPAIKTMRVKITGSTTLFQQDFTFDITGKTVTAMGFVTRSFAFTANSTSTTLAFTSLTAPSGYGAVIDRVYAIAAPACAGDVNGDGLTNVADFNILAGQFGHAVTPFTVGDLNGDGLVNVSDFNILAGDFGCDSV